MKVSVIMSVFNGEQCINASIESILNQTYKNLEFLIIDDGSEDKSLEIIKKYAKKDERIKIIKNHQNIGLTKSLNKAIRQSTGVFIARQDVDDISSSERLEKQLNFLKMFPEYAFCGCNAFRKQNKQQRLMSYFEKDDIKKNLIVENFFTHSSIVIKKEILEKYGYYDETFLYGQDYELWCRLIYKYHLNAKNLDEKLIIMDIPSKRFLEKNLKKFLTQRFNAIRTQIKYFKYTQYKVKCFISMWIRLIEIITLSKLMIFFTNILEKINF